MIAGPDGDDGFKGLKGFPGRDGFDGLKGYRGEMGRNGADGLPGTPGDTLKGMSFVSLSAQTPNWGTPLTPPIWSTYTSNSPNIPASKISLGDQNSQH